LLTCPSLYHPRLLFHTTRFTVLTSFSFANYSNQKDQRAKFFCPQTVSRFFLSSEIIAVWPENSRKHRNSLCGQNAEYFNVYSICTVHTANIKLQMSNTDCAKTCLTALMEYSENTESHSGSKIINMLKFLRFTCSHSIRSPTVTLCANDSLTFPYSAQHISVHHVYRLCDAVRSPVATAIGPRQRHQDGVPPHFHTEVHSHHNAVFPGKRTGSVGPIAWFLWDLVSDAS